MVKGYWYKIKFYLYLICYQIDGKDDHLCIAKAITSPINLVAIVKSTIKTVRKGKKAKWHDFKI